MVLKEKMKLTDEHKRDLTDALRKTGNLPPSQGRVTLNVSPEGKVSSVEINIVRR
jgi:hypothetical protein